MSSTPSPQPFVPAPPCGAASPDDAHRWFREEVQPHDGQLKAWLRGSFPAVQDVDDVVQESYLRIWQRQRAKPILSAKAFLFTAARNIAISLLRRRKASPFDPLSSFGASLVLDHGPNAVDALSARENLDLLAQAVAALPDRCREVILLHKIDGLPQKEVAHRLGLSERTVANHCFVGIRRCEEFFRARGLTGFRQP